MGIRLARSRAGERFLSRRGSVSPPTTARAFRGPIRARCRSPRWLGISRRSGSRRAPTPASRSASCALLSTRSSPTSMWTPRTGRARWCWWFTGGHAELRLPRRRRGQRNSTPLETVEAIRRLALIASDDVVAGVLNRNGAAHRQRQPLNARTRLCVAWPSQDRRVPPGSGWRRALAQPRQRVRAAQSDSPDAQTRCASRGTRFAPSLPDGP